MIRVYERVAVGTGCLVTAGLVLVATSTYGPGLTPDSLTYVSTAISLASAGGFQDHAGEPLVLFPPLYPLLLAPGLWLGAAALSVVRVLNMICTVGIVVVGFSIASRHVSSPGLRLAALATLVLSGPVLFVARYAWSEPLFLLLTLAATYYLERALSSDRRPWVVAAAGLVALACLTRYAGVALILGGATSLLFARCPVRRKVATVAVFVVVAGLPLALWLVRNLVVAGSATGGRPSSSEGVVSSTGRALSVMGAWLVGDWAPATLGVGLMIAFLLAVARLLVVCEHRSLVPLTATTGALLVGSIVSASTTAVDAFDDRLLSPFYVPVAILAFVMLDGWAETWKPTWVLAIAGLWVLAVPAIEVADETVKASQFGAGGYAHTDWQKSEVMQRLREDAVTTPLWTNAPAAVWFLLDGREARLSPRRHAYRSPDTPTNDLVYLEAALGHGPVTVAWFDQRAEPYFLRPDELAALFEVETVASARDGEILAIRSVRGSVDSARSR